MAIAITNDIHYTNIATAIRARNGKVTTYKPNEMAAAIRAIDAAEASGGGKKVTEVDIYKYSGMYSIVFEGGSMVTGSATFDESGNPTSLTDDIGNSVNFTEGYPTSATDKDGNSVPIYWG